MILCRVSKAFVLAISLVPFLGIPGSPNSAYAGGRTGEMSPRVRDAGALGLLARLPDAPIPFGKVLVTISSQVGEDLTGVRVDAASVEAQIDRLAGKLRPVLESSRGARDVVASLNHFLFVEEGFRYDGDAGNPDNFLLDRVLARKRGNCLGLTALYLLLGERFSLPLHGVYVPGHAFVRYEDGAFRRNIETGADGAQWPDGRYRRRFRLSGRPPYLRSLSARRMIAVYLMSLGAAYSAANRDDEALVLYRHAQALFPSLPDLHFDAGVSFHKKGMVAEAVGQYQMALALDPDLTVARGNLVAALAARGRLPDAVAEARRATAQNPRNPVVLAGLAAALCASGRFADGIREYRRVLAIDPGNEQALSGLAKAYSAAAVPPPR